MKLLDPFAGIKLAIGHPLMHIALFCASWILYGAEAKFDDLGTKPKQTQSFAEAFIVIRWCHLLVVILLIPSFFANKRDNKKLEKIGEDLNKLATISNKNRWHMVARACEAIAVFLYIGAVFNAQWSLLEYRVCWI